MKCSGEARHSSSTEGMSPQTEQNILREYCCKRKLHRPDTGVKTVVIWLLSIESSGIAIAFFAGFLFEEFELSRWFFFRPSAWQFYSFGSMIAFVVYAKRLFITVIEAYQHYAPEEVRRRCTLTPSCSEYAILALRKYSVVVGVYKIYVRLTRTCKDGVYKTDYP